jgi:hypothetical protein
MLIHIQPRFFTCGTSGPTVALIDVRVPELDLTLREGTDLVARQPYVNKRYWVAMRRQGRLALQGLRIETPTHLDSFTVETRWAINAGVLAIHRVSHIVLDAEFDAVSDHLLLWHRLSDGASGMWSRRWPDCYGDRPAVDVQPGMTLSPSTRERALPVTYTRTHPGEIICCETLHMHTLERDRLLPRPHLDRLPPPESAFHVGAAA